MDSHASLLFVDGPVLTQDAARPVSDALAVIGGRIVALGDEARALRGPSTRVISLAGRALLPGFVDAHNHFVNYGLRLMRLNLDNLRAKDEIIQAVDQRAKLTPTDGWVVGHSWDETKWRDATLPTRSELDAAAGGRAMLLARVDRHGGLVTSEAMRRAGITPQGDDAFVVEEDYMKVVRLTNPSVTTLVKAIGAASRKAHELGITSSHVMCHGRDFAALQAARAAGTLGIRTSCFIEEVDLAHAVGLGARRGLGDEWVRFLGLKLYADGSFGSRSAAVSAPFLGGGVGEFMHPEGRLESLVKTARAEGLQIAIHAIGDRAAKRVLDAFEGAGVAPEDRARIEHLEMVDDTDIARASAMGIVASVQPNFIGEWGHKGEMYETRLGWARASRLNRFGRYQRDGLPLAFGSDDMPLGPLYGIRSAVEAPEPDMRVSIEAALYAYTAGAAWAGFGENEVGTLRDGLYADLVVLSADPRTTPVADLGVQMTVVDGRVVHEVA